MDIIIYYDIVSYNNNLKCDNITIKIYNMLYVRIKGKTQTRVCRIKIFSNNKNYCQCKMENQTQKYIM